MGFASFTAFMVARVQTSSDGASQPMENSPPGIHAMPLGAGPGGRVLFGIVGANADDGAGSPARRTVAREAAAIISNPMPAGLPINFILLSFICEFAGWIISSNHD